MHAERGERGRQSGENEHQEHDPYARWSTLRGAARTSQPAAPFSRRLDRGPALPLVGLHSV